MFNTFKNWNWRLYFFSQLFALLGTTVQTVVVSWLAYEVTNSALILGFVVAMQYVPLLVFGLFVGHYMDKFSKYNSLRYLQIFQAIWPILIAAWVYYTGVNVYNMLAASTLFGLLRIFDAPLRHSFLSYLVPRDEVKQAYSLYATASQMSRFVAPLVGGGMLLLLSPVWCFILTGLTYFVVIFFYSQMETDKFYIHKDVRDQDSKIMDSLKHIWNHQIIRDLAIVGAFVAIFFWSYPTYFPILVKDVFNSNAIIFSIMVSAYALGALVGNLYSASHKNMSYGHLRKIMILYSLASISFAYVTNYHLALLLIFINGIFVAQINVITNSLVRINAEEKHLGMIISVWMIITIGFTAFGSIYYGFMTDYFDIQTALFVPPLLFLLFAVFYFGKRELNGRI